MVEQLPVSASGLMAALGPKLEFSRDLAPLTSFRTGGKARFFLLAVTTDEIVKAVTGAKKLNVPFVVIGGGSNLLVSDDGYDGLIIKVAVRGMKINSDSVIKCGAGDDLIDLVRFATANSLTGLEFAAGIMGSVGGAIYGNAGAFGGEIGSVVSDVTLFDHNGTIRTVSRDYCRFSYRDSSFKTSGEVVLGASFALKRGDKEVITRKVDQVLQQRKARLPGSGHSAGCFFKNIPDASQPHGKLPAGKLLDEAGVKGLTIGGARVFERHANIIVNSGDATSKDIRQLADIMKQKVLDKFGIELEEEVVQIGIF